MIRTLVVDDEPLARHGVRLRLEREPDVAIVGEAADGPAAIEAIRTLRPELVFLDVQMPGLDGFQVLERVAGDHLPMVVFVTAHEAHAVQAFEVHAIDYLLKPYTDARFGEALRRARTELARGDASPERERIAALLDRVRAEGAGAPAYPARFTVRERDRILLVRADAIEAVRAAGNYVELVAAGRRHLMRETLADMERRLDPSRFARIHRSTIVHVDRVREIRPDPHGDCDVVMESGDVHRMSRAYRGRLLPDDAG